MVVLIGRGDSVNVSEMDIERALTDALAAMSVRDAVDAVCADLGLKRRQVYQMALRLSSDG